MTATVHDLVPPAGRFDDEDWTTCDDVSRMELPNHRGRAEAVPALQPTAEEPLRGLDALAAVATIGSARLHELAGKAVTYVWDDIAVSGTIVLLASGPSEGKTTLLFQILAARANRGIAVWLLERRVQAAPPGTFIVLIEGEHSESSAARKLIASCALLDIKDAALDRIILIARKAVRIGSPEWADIVRLVATGLVSDIAIDTVARVAPSDANDEREQVAVFDVVAQAIDAAPTPEDRPTVWAAAHTRKNGRTGDLADVSGSAQRTGQADTVLMLAGEKVGGRTVSTTVVFSKLREEPSEYPTPVTYAIVSDDSGRKRLRIVDGTQAAGGDDGRPLEDRILDLLGQGPRGKTSLAEKLHRSRKDVDDALSTLFTTRRIETTEINVRGKPMRAFKLRISADFSTDVGGGRTLDGRGRTDS